jgi:hypothetical protein
MLATSTTGHVTDLRKHQPFSVQYFSETIQSIIRLFNKTYKTTVLIEAVFSRVGSQPQTILGR